MGQPAAPSLRVLIANERIDRLGAVSAVVESLGHEVVSRQVEVADVAAATVRTKPDVAIVGLGLDSGHALDLIGKIVREAACPVIALLHEPDPAFVTEAAKRGVFAYVTEQEDSAAWQNAIEIVLLRFAEFQELEGALGRRAVIERANGILMERHGIDRAAAFELLRQHARATNRRVVDVAGAVEGGHRLLPGR